MPQLARVEALRQLEYLAEATEAAREAIASAPESDEAYAAYARVAGQQGLLQEADKAIAEALSLDPEYADYYGYRAQIFYLCGKYISAIRCADKGLQLDPRNDDCLLWRAMSNERWGQPSVADQDFQRLLKLAPDNDLVHAKLGQVFLDRYEPTVANYHLTEALRLSPNRAPELVPLLRRARREQYWPPWFLESERRAYQRWLLGNDRGIITFVNRILATGVVARAWWLTRHDPLFQLSRTQVWEQRIEWWMAAFLSLIPLTYLAIHLNWIDADRPLSNAELTGLFVGIAFFYLIAYLMKRQAKAAGKID